MVEVPEVYGFDMRGWRTLRARVGEMRVGKRYGTYGCNMGNIHRGGTTTTTPEGARARIGFGIRHKRGREVDENKPK